MAESSKEWSRGIGYSEWPRTPHQQPPQRLLDTETNTPRQEADSSANNPGEQLGLAGQSAGEIAVRVVSDRHGEYTEQVHGQDY